MRTNKLLIILAMAASYISSVALGGCSQKKCPENNTINEIKMTSQVSEVDSIEKKPLRKTFDEDSSEIITLYNGSCNIIGKLDSSEYNRDEIENTYYYLTGGGDDEYIWLNSNGIIYDFGDYMDMTAPNKPLADTMLISLKNELEYKLNELDKNQFVKNEYWRIYRQKGIRYIKELAKLKRLTIASYSNPDTLLSYQRANDTLNTLANVLSNSYDLSNPELTLELATFKIHKAEMKRQYSARQDSIFNANMTDSLEITNIPWGYHLANTLIIKQWYQIAEKQIPMEWSNAFDYNFISLFEEITFKCSDEWN